MKIFFNVLFCDIKRTIISWRFLAAVLCFTMVTILTMFDELPSMQPGITSIVYVNLIIGYLDFHMVYLIFAAIPGATLFCSDWDNRFIRFSVVRCSKIKYAASKAIACFCSAVSVIFASEWLTIFILSFRFPFFDSGYEFDYGSYAAFATPHKIFLYFLVKILYKAFCAGFLCVFALWLSTKIINVFVALSTPLLAYYLIDTLSLAINIPDSFSINCLSKGYVNINNQPLPTFLYTILLFTAAAIIFGGCFVKNCKGRIENG